MVLHDPCSRPRPGNQEQSDIDAKLLVQFMEIENHWEAWQSCDVQAWPQVDESELQDRLSGSRRQAAAFSKRESGVELGRRRHCRPVTGSFTGSGTGKIPPEEAHLDFKPSSFFLPRRVQGPSASHQADGDPRQSNCRAGDADVARLGMLRSAINLPCRFCCMQKALDRWKKLALRVQTKRAPMAARFRIEWDRLGGSEASRARKLRGSKVGLPADMKTIARGTGDVA